MRPPYSYVVSDLHFSFKMLEDLTSIFPPSPNLVKAKEAVKVALDAILEEVKQSELKDYE